MEIYEDILKQISGLCSNIFLQQAEYYCIAYYPLDS